MPALRIQQHLLTFNYTIVTVLIGIDLFREILTKHFISQKYGVIINKPNKFHKNDSNSSQGVAIPFFRHKNRVNLQKRRFRQIIV